MRTLLCFSVLCLLSISGFAQRITTLVLTDAQGLRDTVYFGQQNGATAGIDPSLGEIDISSVPMGLSEMRFASRAPLSCFFNAMATYRNHTYESKSDYRGQLNGANLDWFAPNYGLSPAQMEENTFHLKVKCTALPCTLSSVTAGPFPLPFAYSILISANGISSWETDCIPRGSGTTNSILSPTEFPGLVDVISSSTIVRDSTIFYTFFLNNPTTSLPRSLSSLNLKVTNQTLEAYNTITPTHAAIIDMLGREQYAHTWPKGESSIPLPSLTGLYMIRLRYPDGGAIVVRHWFGEW